MSLAENLQIMRDALSPEGSQSIQMLRNLVEQVQKDVDELQKERDQLRARVAHLENLQYDEMLMPSVSNEEANSLEAE